MAIPIRAESAPPADELDDELDVDDVETDAALCAADLLDFEIPVGGPLPARPDDPKV